jgi:hypothetical protein
VRYGDNILQYAVVQTVTGATTYYNYCTDCACQLTVKTLDTAQPVFTSRAMLDLGGGLFGSPATGELAAEQRYRATSVCTSAVYGAGQAESLFTVTESNITAPAVGTNAAGGSLLDTGLQILLQPMGFIVKAIVDAAAAIVDAIKAAFPQVNDFLNLLPQMPSVSQFTWIISFIIGMVTAPFKTLLNVTQYFMITFWLGNWEAIITFFLLPLMLLETAFLGFSVLMAGDDILEILYAYLDIHIKFLKLMYALVSTLAYVAMTLIQTILKMLTAPKEATPLI